jgi:hypothetical protein
MCRAILEESAPVAHVAAVRFRSPGRLTFVRMPICLSTIRSVCWLLASLGVQSLQWRLLSSLWSISPHASLVAIGSLAWMLGANAPHRIGRPVRWEAPLLLGAIFGFLLDWRLPELETLVLGMLLGLSGAGWLAQARPWSAGHCVRLAERTWTLIMSLALVWLLPGRLFALLAFVCLAPLLFIDACQPARFQPVPVAPRPVPGVHRDALRVRLLGCLVEGVQAALWNALLVPLAVEFERSRHLGWFLWLIAGAIAAWTLWCLCERALSSTLRRTWMASLAVAMVASGLLAFALIESPLLLAASMAMFSLGNLLLLWVVPARGAAFANQAGGGQVLEGLTIALGFALSVPIGLLIDLVSIDGTLLLICACLFLFALCTVWDLLISWLVAHFAMGGGGQ